jgi:hypothetical protein
MILEDGKRRSALAVDSGDASPQHSIPFLLRIFPAWSSPSETFGRLMLWLAQQGARFARQRLSQSFVRRLGLADTDPEGFTLSVSGFDPGCVWWKYDS